MKKHGTRGFTLLELMAVVIIILVMLGVVALSFANSRPSIKVKRDAVHMVSFLRNMWDRTKATGAPLILWPDFESGAIAYEDPRDGKVDKGEFVSNAHLIAIKLNDRLYSKASMDRGYGDETYSDTFFDSSIYISEGRGLVRISAVFGLPGEDKDDFGAYRNLTMCTLNLITGKSKITLLTPQELQDVFDTAEEAELQNDGQR